MFHVLIRVEVRHLKKYSRFILKMPDCGTVAVLLIQVITQLQKISCDEEPSMSLQNVKKSAKKCSFLRSYRAAACSFTKK